MGEIFGGIIVMAAFIAFVMWKNKSKDQTQQDKDLLRKQNEEEYWAEKNASQPDIVSSDSSSDD